MTSEDDVSYSKPCLSLLSVLKQWFCCCWFIIYVLPIICGSSVFVFVLLSITLCPFFFCNHLEEEEKAGCFAIIVLQMYCYYKCSVALPHGAVGWSAVCNCGISWSYSLTFCSTKSCKTLLPLLSFIFTETPFCIKYWTASIFCNKQAKCNRPGSFSNW